jgi:hypothetical protein
MNNFFHSWFKDIENGIVVGSPCRNNNGGKTGIEDINSKFSLS